MWLPSRLVYVSAVNQQPWEWGFCWFWHLQRVKLMSGGREPHFSLMLDWKLSFLTKLIIKICFSRAFMLPLRLCLRMSWMVLLLPHTVCSFSSRNVHHCWSIFIIFLNHRCSSVCPSCLVSLTPTGESRCSPLQSVLLIKLSSYYP